MIAEGADEDKPLTWGFWSTLTGGFLVLLIMDVCTQLLLATISYLSRQSGSKFTEHLSTTGGGYNGLFLSLATTISAPLCIAAILGLIALRRGLPVRDYLGLVPVRRSIYLRSFGVLLVFLILSEAVNYVVDRPFINDFMESSYRTAYIVPLFWFAIVIAAPVFEELFFRGFLLTGFRSSFLRTGGAIVLTALVWALIHLQYDWYDMSWIFLFGLILGIARVKSGSLYIPLMMHVGVNFISMLYTAVYLDLTETELQSLVLR